MMKNQLLGTVTVTMCDIEGFPRLLPRFTMETSFSSAVPSRAPSSRSTSPQRFRKRSHELSGASLSHRSPHIHSSTSLSQNDSSPPRQTFIPDLFITEPTPASELSSPFGDRVDSRLLLPRSSLVPPEDEQNEQKSKNNISLARLQSTTASTSHTEEYPKLGGFSGYRILQGIGTSFSSVGRIAFSKFQSSAEAKVAADNEQFFARPDLTLSATEPEPRRVYETPSSTSRPNTVVSFESYVLPVQSMDDSREGHPPVLPGDTDDTESQSRAVRFPQPRTSPQISPVAGSFQLPPPFSRSVTTPNTFNSISRTTTKFTQKFAPLADENRLSSHHSRSFFDGFGLDGDSVKLGRWTPFKWVLVVSVLLVTSHINLLKSSPDFTSHRPAVSE